MLDECGSIIILLSFKDEMVVAGGWSFECHSRPFFVLSWFASADL
jgi:hypothetical protein